MARCNPRRPSSGGRGVEDVAPYGLCVRVGVSMKPPLSDIRAGLDAPVRRGRLYPRRPRCARWRPPPSVCDFAGTARAPFQTGVRGGPSSKAGRAWKPAPTVGGDGFSVKSTSSVIRRKGRRGRRPIRWLRAGKFQRRRGAGGVKNPPVRKPVDFFAKTGRLLRRALRLLSVLAGLVRHAAAGLAGALAGGLALAAAAVLGAGAEIAGLKSLYPFHLKYTPILELQ